MAQNLTTPKKDAKSADKKIVKVDAHGHAHKKPFWSQVGPKLLLPASILLILEAGTCVISKKCSLVFA